MYHTFTFFSFQTTKAVYNRIIDLRIATPQVVINFSTFLEEHHYFEEAFKVCLLVLYGVGFTAFNLKAYERGIALFKWPHVNELWSTYLTKFINRYVSLI